MINTGKRTEWSPIRPVIIRVITKSDDREGIMLGLPAPVNHFRQPCETKLVIGPFELPSQT